MLANKSNQFLWSYKPEKNQNQVVSLLSKKSVENQKLNCMESFSILHAGNVYIKNILSPPHIDFVIS